MRTESFTPFRMPLNYTVGIERIAIASGDVIRLMHEGKFTIMRVYNCRRKEDGTRVLATRKQIDRKGRIVRKGRQRRWYFIPNYTPVIVIGEITQVTA